MNKMNGYKINIHLADVVHETQKAYLLKAGNYSFGVSKRLVKLNTKTNFLEVTIGDQLNYKLIKDENTSIELIGADFIKHYTNDGKTVE